jgi:orotate phosphoribosyltransferase
MSLATDFSIDDLLAESGALRRGHFLLSSGLHSAAYVQCALLLEEPKRARQVGEALAEMLEPYELDSILSPALGGVIIGHEVAAALGIPFRFTERKGEAMELRRGFTLRPGERVAIVEDVITTGRSTEETVKVAKALGAEPMAAAAIIDRTGGSSALTLPFEALLRLDLPTYDAASCPLCQSGSQAEKPGSRPQPAAA